jgi:cbb3-type cytochrome oxidase subunit 3
MYQDFFSKSPLLALPLMALFLFIVVFAAIVIHTFGRRGRETALAASSLPLTADAESFPRE